jgi:tetratricopeptide (TPR) repeat protein
VAHAAKGDYQQAIADFDRVIKKNSKHAQAYYQRSLAYKHLGGDVRAKDDHDAAIRIDPKLG